MGKINGLILVGGKSIRMGEDKALLIYRDGVTEIERLYMLLGKICDQVFLCHREGQDYTEVLPDAGVVHDQGDGPLPAISAAQHTDPDASWFVVGCDLPLLGEVVIEKLMSERDASAIATCYDSVVDGMPEPLCCVFETTSRVTIDKALAANQYCPRDVLLDAKRLKLEDKNALMNANSPADVLEVKSVLEGTRETKLINLLYFAQLQESTKLTEEKHETESMTASGLYEELKAKYGFKHKQKHLMLAINEEFQPWETPLKHGDVVAFIPPVAGG